MWEQKDTCGVKKQQGDYWLLGGFWGKGYVEEGGKKDNKNIFIKNSIMIPNCYIFAIFAI